MIPTDLAIGEIAQRVAGVVVAPNMVRAPGPGQDEADRSLLVLKTAAGLIVLPQTDGDLNERARLTRASQAYVSERIGVVCGERASMPRRDSAATRGG